MDRGRGARAVAVALMVAAPVCAFFVARGIPLEWRGMGSKNVLKVDVLVAVYTNTVGGTTTAQDITALWREVAEAREFFWRNSRLVVDLAIDYTYIDEFLAETRFLEAPWGGYWLPPSDVNPMDGEFASVEQDLRARGVRDDQYDGVVVFYAWDTAILPAAYGGTTFGVDYGFLGSTGYTDIPLCWDPLTWSWYFVHEFNHQVDSMLEYCGYPAFQNPDLPWTLDGDFGENYDYNAFFMRLLDRDAWGKLASKGWGRVVGMADFDGDGVPDDGDFPLTETTAGSSPAKADTDDDGLGDLDEIIAGLFTSSNPLDPDTDGDGIFDGIDPYPLYPVNERASPGVYDMGNDYDLGTSGWILDGPSTITPATFQNISLAATWNETGLNLIMRVPDAIDRFTIHLDMQDDGWFHGRENIEINVRVDTQSMVLHTWASDPAVIATLGVPAWDDEAAYLACFDPVIDPSETALVTWDDGAYTGIKIRFPWDMAVVACFGILVTINRIAGHPCERWLFEENVLLDVAVVEA
ncbi:MAG: hypothetical protein Q6365_001125 [Candidatus Sigynarchaeota archaeon]